MANAAKKQPKNTRRQPAKSPLPSSSARIKTKAASRGSNKTPYSPSPRVIKKNAKTVHIKSNNNITLARQLTVVSARLPFSSKKLKLYIEVSEKQKPARIKSRVIQPLPRLSGTARFKQLLFKKRQANPAWFFVLLGVAGLTFFGLKMSDPPNLQAKNAGQTSIRLPDTEKTKTLTASTATRLRIPDIGLDSEVTTVGKNADNTIEVPADYRIAGLYRFGPTPGELGPAIIVGHVDNFKGPGVFWRLRDMQPGQIISIARADGSTANFKVAKVNNFSQKEFPTQEIYGDIDHPGLRLITCGGTFNVFTQRYSENTVVFAELM